MLYGAPPEQLLIELDSFLKDEKSNFLGIEEFDPSWYDPFDAAQLFRGYQVGGPDTVEISDLSELDFLEFLAENTPDLDDKKSVSPVDSSIVKRSEQDESKASHTQAQSSNSEKNTSLTPAFKAAAKRQNKVALEELPPRKCKIEAREKLKKYSPKGSSK